MNIVDRLGFLGFAVAALGAFLLGVLFDEVGLGFLTAIVLLLAAAFVPE